MNLNVTDGICDFTGELTNIAVSNSTLSQPTIIFNQTANYLTLGSMQWDFDFSFYYNITGCFE